MNIFDYEQFKIQAQRQRMDLKEIDVSVFITSQFNNQKNHDLLKVKSLKIVASEIFEVKPVMYGSAHVDALHFFLEYLSVIKNLIERFSPRETLSVRYEIFIS